MTRAYRAAESRFIELHLLALLKMQRARRNVGIPKLSNQCRRCWLRAPLLIIDRSNDRAVLCAGTVIPTPAAPSRGERVPVNLACVLLNQPAGVNEIEGENSFVAVTRHCAR